jgi:hypothetical protein
MTSRWATRAEYQAAYEDLWLEDGAQPTSDFEVEERVHEMRVHALILDPTLGTLFDRGLCHPMCAFALRPKDQCGCRCGERYHGEYRDVPLLAEHVPAAPVRAERWAE